MSYRNEHQMRSCVRPSRRPPRAAPRPRPAQALPRPRAASQAPPTGSQAPPPPDLRLPAGPRATPTDCRPMPSGAFRGHAHQRYKPRPLPAQSQDQCPAPLVAPPRTEPYQCPAHPAVSPASSARCAASRGVISSGFQEAHTGSDLRLSFLLTKPRITTKTLPLPGAGGSAHSAGISTDSDCRRDANSALWECTRSPQTLNRLCKLRPQPRAPPPRQGIPAVGAEPRARLTGQRTPPTHGSPLTLR